MSTWDEAHWLAEQEILLDQLVPPELLDQFIRDYCRDHDIMCDGDVFGQVFQGRPAWTRREAGELIEKSADHFDLRKRNHDL